MDGDRDHLGAGGGFDTTPNPSDVQGVRGSAGEAPTSAAAHADIPGPYLGPRDDKDQGPERMDGDGGCLGAGGVIPEVAGQLEAGGVRGSSLHNSTITLTDDGEY